MNRLSDAHSSYLKSAAHQPVAWYPWSAEAFERAKAEDKPILLDIGAVWCHWCHVMDHESYEDAALADLINREFVAVKVDRDERPDVDARYQKVVQAMTGQGGWPLTAFLLADGRCFYGGTYFPPIDAHGRPSFRRVLEAVADAHRSRRDEILGNADALAKHLARPRGKGQAAEGQGLSDLLDHAVGHARELFDPEEGGFGRAPKFPHAAAHDWLLQRGLRGDKAALDMVVAALDAMQRGGIHDHVGGGFHRYSVDAEWHVPHFEKMLYDNAGLLRNYARASRELGRDDLRDTALGIVSFLRDVLQHPEGGFGGSQDADVGADDDGDFFTWTLDELRAALPDPDLARLAAMHFDVREQGDMHHDRKRCVLRVIADAEAIAAALQRPVVEVRASLAKARLLLAQTRAHRPTPFVDPMRYAAWNGMAIQALLELGGLHDDKLADRMALRALDAFLSQAWDRERGFARHPGGRQFGLLDDNAQMLDALLEAYLATGEARYLDAARATADLLISRFAHPDGGFVDRAEGLAPAEVAVLSTQERPIQDAPTASPNGVALAALLRLSDATGEDRYHQFAERSLRALAPEAAQLSVFGGALLLALERLERPAPRIVVPRGDVAEFRATVRRFAGPGATLLGAGSRMPEEARAYAGPGALVCVGTRCLAPAETAEALASRLAEARKG